MHAKNRQFKGVIKYRSTHYFVLSYGSSKDEGTSLLKHNKETSLPKHNKEMAFTTAFLKQNKEMGFTTAFRIYSAGC